VYGVRSSLQPARARRREEGNERFSVHQREPSSGESRKAAHVMRGKRGPHPKWSCRGCRSGRRTGRRLRARGHAPQADRESAMRVPITICFARITAARRHYPLSRRALASDAVGVDSSRHHQRGNKAGAPCFFSCPYPPWRIG
jgi:hypothetical protein